MHTKITYKDRRDQSKQTCDDKNLVEVILLGLYMLFIVLIFVNILIAIFRIVWFCVIYHRLAILYGPFSRLAKQSFSHIVV